MVPDNSVSYFIFQCLVISTIIYYVLFIYEKRRFFKFAWNNNMFFVPVLPIVGTTYMALILRLFHKFEIEPLSVLQTWKKIFDFPANLWIGHSYYYITTDPKEIKIILNHPKCCDKGEVYKPLKYVFNNSLLCNEYKEWKPKRKYFLNGFKPAMIKEFMPTFYEESCKLLKNIQNLNENGRNDISHVLFNNVSSTFYLTSAGLKKENLTLDIEQLSTIIPSLQEDFATKICFPFISSNLWLRFTPYGRKITQNKIKLKNIMEKIIKQKRAQDCGIQASTNADKNMTILDLIMNDSNNISDHGMIDELTFFSSAAIETTSVTLSLCFTLIGMHPIVQEKLLEEIMDQIGFNDDFYDDLPNLKYTESVILESMRIISPVPFIVRRAVADINLGNKVIPEGANIVIDIFHLQRDEKYWPNPLKFDPTRFLPENTSSNTPYAYLPFAGGPRDCLGKAQAIALMKTTVANVIRNYKVTSNYKSVEDVNLRSTLTTQVDGPLDCQFTLRSKK